MNQTVRLEEYARKESRLKAFLTKYGMAALFLGVFLACFITFFVVPLFYGIHISLTNFKYDYPGREKWNNFRYYKMLFDPSFKPLIYESFWRAFWHTIVFAILMVPMAILVPLILAIFINSKPPGYKVFRCLVYMPSIVPLTAAGSIFTLLFNAKVQHGLLAELFPNTIGKIDFPVSYWPEFTLFGATVNVSWMWVVVYLMCFWGGWGGNFLILSAGLQNVPKPLYEAAGMDGCNGFKKALKVTIPNIKPQIVLCLFTTIIGYMGLYGQNYVLAHPLVAKYSSQPGGVATSTLIYFIQSIVAGDGNAAGDMKANYYGLAAAASVVFALIVGIMSGTQMYLTRDKKTGNSISRSYEKWNAITR